MAFYATSMPHRATSRASGINPTEGLSFSGVVVAQTYTGASNSLFQEVASAGVNSPLVQAAATEEESFSAGLLDPEGVSAGLAASGVVPLSSGSVSSSLSADDDELAASIPSGCDTSASELYCVYEIQEGDTLSELAETFGLTSNDNVAAYEKLARSNRPDIVSADDLLQPGQKIRIPLHDGVLHTVLVAETLIEIADNYGVAIEDILAVPGNGITDPDNIGIGVNILIPDPQQFAPLYTEDTSGAAGDGSGGSSGPDIVTSGLSSASGLIWPAAGPISSYYGPNHPLGIDIDLFNNGGAPIGAAAGGVVTFAGGDPCCSYGYYVVIDHGNGYTTLYAHLSSIGVSVGEVVAQGQYLGNGGTTGYSTGDHLHFEVKLNGVTVNPLNHLP